MDQFKDDLKILEIDEAKSEIVTIREVIKAYRKKAFRVHSDTSGYESTSDFQVLSNAYERAIKYLVEKHKAKKGDDTGVAESSDNDEERFTRENFDRFNFPKRNSDCFTVMIENNMADTWQECFEQLYGKPNVNKIKSSGTEAHSKSGRLCYSPSVKQLGRTKTMRRVKEKVLSYTEVDERLLDEDTSISEIEEIEEITVVEKSETTSSTVREPLSFRCLECDYRAMDKFQMEVHVKDLHKDISDANCINYMFIECGKVFDVDESYQKHMETHSEDSVMKATHNVRGDFKNGF